MVFSNLTSTILKTDIWCWFLFPLKLRRCPMGLPSFNRWSKISASTPHNLHTQCTCILPVCIHMYYIYIYTSWWFQPIWKIFVKMDHSPNFRGENKNIFETTNQYISRHPCIQMKLQNPFQLFSSFQGSFQVQNHLPVLKPTTPPHLWQLQQELSRLVT